MAKTTYQIKRSLLNGVILRPFGLTHWGIAQQDDDGIILFSGERRYISFSDLAGPVIVENSFGFTNIVLSLGNGEKAKVAGLKLGEAESFASTVNNAFRRSVVRQYETFEQEIQTLCEAVARLDNPRRYPSACLLNPFVDRARNVIATLPTFIPDGTLNVEQQQFLDVVRAFAEAPLSKRKEAIQTFIDTELLEMKDFFDTIETNPLTPEQRQAVITDEDATLVLAGAGSGKTSVIVAKAAYLIARDIRRPEEILLMAFGKDAATEMAERINERSGAAVDAMTFHALGNKIIREVDGKGPALGAHAEDDAKFRALLRDILVTDIAKKKGLENILLDWFSEFYWPYKNEWDFKKQSEYFEWVEAHELRTLNGDLVKSFEEWEIGNWLYRNGIEHEYESLYEHELPKHARGAYHPDFRLIESGIYIEHFGVRKTQGADGSVRLTTAPYIDRERYLEDMAWKRQLHSDNGTTLVETFSYEKVEGRLLDALREKLAPFVELKPIHAEQAFGTLAEMGQIDVFTQTLGTFLRHFKSSSMSIRQCQTRCETAEDARRNFAFLKIFEPLFDAYQQRLGDKIDFEDMINRATEHVEAGHYKSPYRHLLVDEFQDISEGRACLLRALKAQHADARIFAVGDDWQSIFRFAGSDIHLMGDFGEEFGGVFENDRGIHSIVDLGRTFRSVDKIALPARRFVLQNPSQIEKQVATITTSNAPAIKMFYYSGGQDTMALKETLSQISEDAVSGTSVLLLGRYNFLRPKNMRNLAANFPKLSLSFKTAHGSKGLEADHAVILRASSGTMGFPSEIVDDPLLDLVLPKPENFDHAEERRLFYVALTRARKSVTILADQERPSEFVRELTDDPAYQAIVLGATGEVQHRCVACGGRMLAKSGKNDRRYFACEHRSLCGEILQPCNVCGNDLPVKSQTDTAKFACSCGAEYLACPDCADGWLVERRGKYGIFLGCVKYPACRGKKQFPNGDARRRNRQLSRR